MWLESDSSRKIYITGLSESIRSAQKVVATLIPEFFLARILDILDNVDILEILEILDNLELLDIYPRSPSDGRVPPCAKEVALKAPDQGS